MDTLAGACLCGAVTISLSEPKPHIEVCQCTTCRRWGGAFFAGQDGGEVEIAGEAHVRTFQSSAWAERAFCDRCGSHLWFRFLPTGHCSFCAGLFDASIDKPIEKEIFCDEAASWTHLIGDHDRKTGAEIIAEAEAAGFTFE